MADPFDPTHLPRPVLEGDEPVVDQQLEATFREEKGGALLTIELPPLQPRIELAGKVMILKPEFHVTMVGFAAKLDKKCKEAAAAKGESISNAVAAERVKAALQSAADGMTFKIRFFPEARRAVKAEAETIIKVCEVEGLAQYLSKVETALGLSTGSVELPPTHTTVYTLENGQGIGIANAQQLAELTTPLTSDELEELRRVSVLPTD